MNRVRKFLIIPLLLFGLIALFPAITQAEGGAPGLLGILYSLQEKLVCWKDRLLGEPCRTIVQPPLVYGVSGPVELGVREAGVWSVHATTTDSSDFSYSVFWGDEVGTLAKPLFQVESEFTHSYSSPGVYHQVYFVVDNSSGLESQARYTVSVAGEISSNLPPKITGASEPGATILGEDNVEFRWTATDADGDSLAWSIDFNDDTIVPPATLCLSPIPSVFTAKHNWQAVGTYNVRVSVTDCRGGVDSREFTVVVREPTPQDLILKIVSSNPPDGAVDGREYLARDSWGNVYLTFSTNIASNLPTLSDFQLTSTQTGNPPVITAFLPDDKSSAHSGRLILSRSIFPGERISINYRPGNYSLCVGVLPGDVNQDGNTNFADAGTLNAWLKDPETRSITSTTIQMYRKDINRDGLFDENDLDQLGEILTAINPLLLRLPGCPARTQAGLSVQSQTASAFLSPTLHKVIEKFLNQPSVF